MKIRIRHSAEPTHYPVAADVSPLHLILRVVRADSRRLLRFGGSRRQSAFTLVEMLLVLVIIGVLAAIVIPKIAGRGEDARIQAAKTQISSFGTALDMFEVDNGYYPRGKDGLNDLLQTPRDASNWKGPYLKSEIPLDPWGNAYSYESPGKQNTTGYDISSAGPNGRAGDEDDLTSWSASGTKK